MTVLVTGAAGFIGSHVSHALLDRGDDVLGLDNMNDYYNLTLKEARLRRLELRDGFRLLKADVSDKDAIVGLAKRVPEIDRIIHLAAQAGVRHSLTDPHAYTAANIEGQLNILELARALPDLRHLAYASSSSVYGGNTDVPFSVEDRVEKPVSLYAATKRAGELMSYCYSHLYGIPATGLRFFTVYGPWGRPDMSAYIFTKAIFEGKLIKVFNNGDMRRDFTFIDDIVAGVLAALDHVPQGTPPQTVYNLGNNQSEPLMRFIEVLEQAIGREAIKEFAPMQPGDVKETYADIGASQRELGFEPVTSIDEGLPRFVEWFRNYHGYN
ncbi:MAG: protein CapI [Rhodospirillaceae bacterium]|nr:protein CapI [Rhodospirillaceae bacterium]|tara:strand:+ start:41858 stop:42832 length:975 start_codon:yes stop_codon:yes gene_type:complete